MSTSPLDIAIVGGGPVGSTLALALAAHWPRPGRIALFDQRPLDQALESTRGLALNAASQRLLQSVDAWPAHAIPLIGVQVSQLGFSGKTHIRAQDLNVPALGYVVSYADLMHSLRGALAAACAPANPSPPSEVALSTNAALQCFHGHHVSLDSVSQSSRVRILGETASWQAALVARADGTPERPQINSSRSMPDEAALVIPLEVERPWQGWALQRFCHDGTLAFLPRGDDRYTAVFTAAAPAIGALAALPPGALAAWLNTRMGDTLGKMRPTGTPQSHPVGNRVQPPSLSSRIVPIGNAAQTLHPVAAQGLNLGLRDAATLAKTLLSIAALPDARWESALSQYQRQRQRDRWLSRQITTWLPRPFISRIRPLAWGADQVLRLLDAVPALHRPLTRQLLWGRT